MKIKYFTLALAAILPSGASAAQSGHAYLTPSRINYNEQLPNHYSSIDFNVFENDWMDRVRLPAHDVNPGEMSIMLTNNARAGATVEILGRFSHLPSGVERITLPSGTWLDLDKRPEGWQVLDGYIRSLTTPNTPRWHVPAMGRRFITQVALRDGEWAREIGLPSLAQPYDMVTIRNDATWSTRVLGENVLFPNAQGGIRSGDVHHYVFDPNHHRWKLEYASLVPVSIEESLGTPEWPRTHVELKPTDQLRALRFPAIAHDRDRRILSVHSDIPRAVKLATSNVFGKNNTYIELQPGQSMEAIYLDDNGPGSGQWHPVNDSIRYLDESQLDNGRLKDAHAWRTHVTTWGKTLYLPTDHRYVWDNARVTVENTEPNATAKVYASSVETLQRREQAVFRAQLIGGRIRWFRETETIDVTLVGPPGPGRPDEDILVLMRENLKRTNEALQNSGATFLLREAVATNYKVPAGMPTDAIPEWLAQQPDFDYEVSRFRSDGMYYGGFAEGCSGSHHSAEKKRFVLAINVLCPTDVLREEVGKALGMKINGKQPVPVIGSGNIVPMYPTATRVLEDGSRAINAGQRDEVPYMNGVAAEVARYSDSLTP